MMPPSGLVGVLDEADEDAEQILSLFDSELHTPVLNNLEDESYKYMKHNHYGTLTAYKCWRCLDGHTGHSQSW